MGVLHGLHRDAEIREIIKRVEDTEDVHAAGGGVFHETGHDVAGIVRVADGVGAAEQHLKTDVGDAGAELAEPLPRVLIEKPHGGVERGAAPHFEGEEVRRAAGEGVGGREHVVAADARGHE